MDAIEKINDWKQRLMALAYEKPPVSCRTTEYEFNLYWRKLTTIQGYTEKEVASAEKRLGIQFPVMYRTFLREMGRSSSLLFWGCGRPNMDQFEYYKQCLLKFMSDSLPASALPKEAVVFLMCDQYEFLYILGNGEVDSPVFMYRDDGDQDHMLMIYPTFADLIEEEVQVVELIDRENRRDGNYGLMDHPLIHSNVSVTVDSEGRPLPRPWWLREGI